LSKYILTKHLHRLGIMVENRTSSFGGAILVVLFELKITCSFGCKFTYESITVSHDYC